MSGEWLLWLQQKLKTVLGLAPCLLKGRGFFQYSFGLLPHRRTIVTVGKDYFVLALLTASTLLILQGDFEQKYFWDEIIKVLIFCSQLVSQYIFQRIRIHLQSS